MNRRRLALLSVPALALALPVSTAHAWDSVVDTSNHNLPRVGIITAARPESPKIQYILGVSKDRTGGTSAGSADDLGISNLYSCAPGFDDTLDFNASTCGFATNSDLRGASWGWLRLRLAANLEHESEHYLIAREAARQAGLLDSTTIFDPFFVRYPTRNARLVSQVNLKPDGGLWRAPRDARLIVGQSWLPTEPGVSEAHAVRPMSLLELAQLPDFSNSVADWAAGNELCPFTGLESDFNATFPAVENCHRFEAVMGALNVTHFAPLNRQIWAYYHELAMTRMQECSNLANLAGPFYANVYPLNGQTAQDNISVVSGNDTEAHECEREAMLYEMFAQHFMQDAWSTGHMWKRWGQTQIDRFPDDFSLANALGPAFTEDEIAPRQTAIAMLVGAISGEVHGAKPVILDQVREYLTAARAQDLRSWVTDDPLNGPTYPSDLFGQLHNLVPALGFGGRMTEREKIRWLDSNNVLHTGAGDLFWDPDNAPQGTVSNSDAWTFQRENMIRCTAASMLQTYNAGLANGTRASGPVDISKAAGLDGVDPASDACWSQWATNKSMRAALGFDLNYFDFSGGNSILNVLGSSVTFLVNRLIFSPLTSLVGFVQVPSGQATTPAQEVLAQSRDKFLIRLQLRMQLDVMNIRTAYSTNMEDNPDGIESARGVDDNVDPISLINTLPFADPPKDAKLSDSVPYIDKLIPQTDIGRFDTSSELDSAVSRVFWRGNIVRTCQESVESGAATLLELRARCVAAAENGGNADVCTDCVNMAEPLIPDCGAKQSKCGAALNQSGATAYPGLPSWWFDFDGRSKDQLGDLPLPTRYSGEGCLPPFYVAVDWCTRTRHGHSDTQWQGAPTTIRCTADSSPLDFGTFKERVGTILTEPNFNTKSWVPQMVTARTDTTTTVPPDNQCDVLPKSVTHSYDALVNALLTAHEDPGQREMFPLGTPEYPRCGGLLVYEGWDRNCDVAQSQLTSTHRADGYSNAVTGEQVFGATFPSGAVCALVKPRQFVPSCPNGLQCNAGGECVPSTQCDAGGDCTPPIMNYRVVGAQKPPAPPP